MDPDSRRPRLPALSYLDIDKVKREEDLYQSGLAGTIDAYNGAADVSYPSGPPPPYSRPQPVQNTNAWEGMKSMVQNRSETRSTSGDELDNVKSLVRQSLPSISEALGVERQTPHQQHASITQAPIPQYIAPPSPLPNARRAYENDTTTSVGSYANVSRSYESFRHDSVRPSPHLSSEAKLGPSSLHESRQPLYLQTSLSDSHGRSIDAPSQHERYGLHSSDVMGPPTRPYGYTPYTSNYAQLPQSTSQSAGPIYQPSSRFAAPSTPSPSWKNDTVSSRSVQDDRATPSSAYSNSVKRHLDLFDLEAALNEIAQSSGILADFSRRYGDRMHHSARSGVHVNSLPGLVEVDDMISKSRLQLESLHKIREVTLAQQVAYAQDVAEERQRKAVPEPLQPSPAPALEQTAEDENPDLTSTDSKKRRGRAAPPGRCHSCQRAETPEWRRGPDGARTLCNACGLHYAKLTRKQSSANKSNVSSSNLRPKET